MPRTVEVEMLDGTAVELNSSVDTITRVEESFGMEWNDVLKEFAAEGKRKGPRKPGEPGRIQRLGKLFAAMADMPEADVNKVLDVPAINDFADKLATLFGAADEDDQGNARRAPAGSRVPGSPKKRPAAKKKPKTRKTAQG